MLIKKKYLRISNKVRQYLFPTIESNRYPTAVRHLRTLLSLVLTNSEVRKLLSDFSTIGRDLLSIAAKEAAILIAPDADKLADANEPGPKDRFVTEGGRTAGKDETPVLEAQVPGTDATLKHHPRQDDDVKLRSENGTERPVGEMARKGKQAVEGEYEAQKSAGGTVDQDRVKEAGRAVVDRTDVDSENMREVAGSVDKVKQGVKVINEDVREPQESGSEGETEGKKQGFLNKMKGYRVSSSAFPGCMRGPLQRIYSPLYARR